MYVKTKKIRSRVSAELQSSKQSGGVVLIQPAPVRIFHWGFAFSMIVLLLTGFELHRPFSFIVVSFSQMFIYHVTAAWLCWGFLTYRIADMIIRKDNSWIVNRRDIKCLPKLASYYLFLRNSPPPHGKYHSAQKMELHVWLFVFSVASVLGFATYLSGEHFQWLLRITNGWQMVREIKFVSAIFFTATISHHIYLSVFINFSHLQAMISGYERKEP